MKKDTKQSAIAYGIAVGMTVVGCCLTYVINRWSYSVLDAVNHKIGITDSDPVGVQLVLLALIGIALAVFLTRKRNIKVYMDFDPRIWWLFLVNFLVAYTSGVLIGETQQAWEQEQPVTATLSDYVQCLNSQTGQACDRKNIAGQLSNFEGMIDNFSNYSNMLRIFQVVAGITILLIVLATIVVLFKSWMVDLEDPSKQIQDRRQTIANWYSRVSVYPVGFVVLTGIVLQILKGNTDSQSLKYTTPIVLGILGLIEGSIIFNFAKDVWSFIFADDWHQAKKSDAVSMVSKDLGLRRGLILVLLFFISLIIGMLTRN